jgi:hypothetical protein
MDPALFFPTRGEPVEPARLVCIPCPVQAECREWGLAYEIYGVWGGLAESQRAAVRRTLGLPTPVMRAPGG